MMTLSIILAALVFIQGGYAFVRYTRLFKPADVQVFIIAWISYVFIYAFLFAMGWHIFIVIQSLLCLAGDRYRLTQIKKQYFNK